MLVLAILLFIALSPGLLVRIPTKGPLLNAVLVHAAVFGLLLYVSQMALTYEGFEDDPPVIERAPPLMAVTLSSADISPIVAKVQLPSGSGKTIKMALPTAINTINPVSATVDGNVLGSITFPDGVNMPSGEYTVVMGPT